MDLRNGKTQPSDGHAEPTREAALRIVDALESRVHDAYNEGLAKAMTAVWDERGKYSVLSPEFFVLTKIWETLFAETNRGGHRH